MDGGKIVNDLNSRQWKLYDFLKTQTKYLSRRDILKELSELYGKTHHTNDYPMRALTRDLQAIKDSVRIDKVLITSRKGIKLAQTYNEFVSYYENEKIETLSRLKRIIAQGNKMKNNGQHVIVFGKEKDIVEALNNVENVY